MGECGCTGRGERHWLPGPNGMTYQIQLDPPCRNCESPAGVTVHRYDKAMTKDCDVRRAAPLAFWDDEASYATVGLSVIDPPHARAALMRWMKDRGIGKDEFDREGFAEEIWDLYLEPVLFLGVDERVDDGAGPAPERATG